MKKWTDKEDLFLIKNYNRLSFSEVKKYFNYSRSDDAIRWRAKLLGLTTKKNEEWTDEEIEMLKTDMPSLIISHKTGRTVSAVNKRRAIERAKHSTPVNYAKLFDLSAIEDGVPNVNLNSKSAQYLALLDSLTPGQSFEYPINEKELVRNQIYLLPNKKFQTKKWTDTTRRVWRLN